MYIYISGLKNASSHTTSMLVTVHANERLRFEYWEYGMKNAHTYSKNWRQLDPKQLVADKMGRERGKYVDRFYVPKYR